MATIAKNAPKVKPSTTAELFVRINGTMYRLSPNDPGECGSKAWRLEKAGDAEATYDVIRNHFGEVECSCPDYAVRHEGKGTCCKHGASLVQLGLLPAPKPVAVPTPAELADARARMFGVAGVTRVRDEFDDDADDFSIAPTAPAGPAKVRATEWATAISGRLWDVATEAQRRFAVELLNADYLGNQLIEPIGPTLAELQVLLDAPKVAAPCCPADEAQPCTACASGFAAELAAAVTPAPVAAELPAPGPGSLWDYLMTEAGRYMVEGTPQAKLVARTIERLAAEVLAASTPGVDLVDVDEFLARREAMAC